MCVESDQEFSNFVVPTEYNPGIDLISKVILTDVQVIDIITSTLVQAPKDSYVVEPLLVGEKDVLDKGVSHVLYISRTLQNNLPPILVNIIETSEQAKTSHIILQCTNIYQKYNTHPICVIIAAQQLDKDIIKHSSQHQELPFLREMSCTFWAEQCLLTSSKESKIKKSELKHHPLLDIITAITSYEKVVLCNNVSNA